ncbi:MAG: valine--tRNA ligase [Firmicutes bacterium]|nr:valine--tRNA ligase [Bacillota bacterium]
MDLNKQYNPKEFETRVYNEWLNKKYFKANEKSRKPAFSVLFPPPNITDRLHVGHALNAVIQDILTRFKRMQGYETLWQPGTDHAAIASEAKVVSKLAKEGKKREDFTREEFEAEMQAWYNSYGNQILNQCKGLGVSWDWDRIAFTRDEPRNKAVAEAFVRLYNEGLIYRGARVTNWCPHCMTAISDIESEHEEQQTKLYHIKYPLADGAGSLTVATTRPETLFGDLAVAVNPTDKRFKSFIGKQVLLPLTARTIPVIADDYVDVAFGTGALKITPSHDANDYDVGARHNLGLLNVFNKDGTLNEQAGKFAKMSGTKARAAVVAELKKQGLLLKEEDYTNSVGCCWRCHTTVESLVTEQWFVEMRGIAKEALKLLDNINIYPANQKPILKRWIENTRDWCISRQIWSGHRIPVYTCSCGLTVASVDKPKKCKCGGVWVQDPDVLDTWFSSGLWPLTTLGWPKETKDLQKFAPFDVLGTAYDIIFYWCARMIFYASHFRKEVPFKNLLLHGLVRDAQGRKMSKNLGNGVDPEKVVEEYGADALRFALVYGISTGGDSCFSYDKVLQARNFANKLWNAARFTIMNVNAVTKNSPSSKGCPKGGVADAIGGAKALPNINNINLTLPDKWILTELNNVVKRVIALQDKFDFGLSLNDLYEFTWNKFCDYYIEFCKPNLMGGVSLRDAPDTTSNEAIPRAEDIALNTAAVLKYVLTQILKLLHPYMPFVTEEIFSKLETGEDSIMISGYPTENKGGIFNATGPSAKMESVMDIVRQIRNIRAELGIKNSVVIPYSIFGNKRNEATSYIEALTNIQYSPLRMGGGRKADGAAKRRSGGVSVATSSHYKLYLETAGLIDTTQEAARLKAEIAKLTAEIDKINGSLNNANFKARAPEKVIKEYEANIAVLIDKRTAAEESLKKL